MSSRSRLELKVPPDAVWLAAAALMWLVADLTPDLHVPGVLRAVAAGLLFAAGVVLIVAARVTLKRAHTTWHALHPEQSATLVTWGAHRYSRHPMYLGMLLVLIGLSVALASPAALVLTAPFVLYLDRFQIAPEERALIELAGDEYRTYARRVRRWV